MTTQPMSGKVLQDAVIALAHYYNYKVAHFASVLATGRDGVPRWRTPVVADGKGWLDLFLVRKGRAVAIEIKGDGDRLRPEQKAWIGWLTEAGIEAVVVSPKDWRDGKVDALLR